MTILLFALLALYIIVFFVFIWKSAETWRWYQLLSTSIAMLLTVIFLFPLAAVLKSRSAWSLAHEKLEQQLKNAERENEQLLYGDSSDPTFGQGFTSLQTEIRRMSFEVGQVWRHLELQGNDPNSLQFQVVKQEEALDLGLDEEEDAPAEKETSISDSLPAGLLLYGFRESEIDGILSPTEYMGEFRVTASEGQGFTIQPTDTLDETQKTAIANGNARHWSLYELMPRDDHRLFVAPGSTPTDDALFGRIDNEQIQSMFGEKIRPETRTAYERDGLRAEPNDPPKTRWVKVEFIKPYQIDVDSANQADATVGSFFDSIGRVVDSRLQQIEGSEVSIAAGDVIVILETVAKTLIEDGVAKLIDTYYVRPLNDYRFKLKQITMAIREASRKQTKLKRQSAELEKELQTTEALLVKQQQEKQLLEQDLEQVKRESRAIESHNALVSSQLKKDRIRRLRLYRSNQSNARQLAAIHLKYTQEINRRTQAAAP